MMDGNQSGSEDDEVALRDSSHMLNIFPEEIWGKILDKSNDPSGLEILCNSSLFFRNILYAKRPHFLFPNVWKILGIKYETDEDDAYFEKRNSPGSPFSNELAQTSADSRLSRNRLRTQYHSTVLNLRLTCKLWNATVDNFYQNLEETFFERFSENDNYCVQKFIDHFENTHAVGSHERSPFLERAISIEYTLNDDDAIFGMTNIQFRSQINILLLKYGEHIRHCSIRDYYENFSSERIAYSQLEQTLRLVPNLKTLKISYISNSSLLWSFMDLNQLENKIFMNPLPTFEKLEKLSVCNLWTAVFNEIFRKNSGITMLEVERSENLEDECAYDIHLVPTHNLRQLTFQIFYLEEFEKLERSEPNWKLFKLHLDFRHCHEFIPWSRVFKLSEKKWVESVTDLKIGLPIAKSLEDAKIILKECNEIRIDLGFVKRLKLVMHDFTSLDFILSLAKTLEELSVYFNYDLENYERKGLALKVEMNQKIEFIGYLWNQYESNIWNLLPSLKSLTVGEGMYENVYTRAEWKSETITNSFLEFVNEQKRLREGTV